MNNEELQKLKALALEATKGPWYVQYGDDNNHMCMTGISANKNRIGNDGKFSEHEPLIAIGFHQSYPYVNENNDAQGDANSEFIAAANPAAVLELIALAERTTQPAQDRCCEHDSDCAVHNAPALPVGPCDCTLSEKPAQEQVAAVRAVPETHSARRIITQLETAERGFICPLCGKDFPHGHTPAEISIYRNGFKAAIHQQELIGAEHQGVAEDARVDSGAVSTGGGAGSNECNEHRGRKSENNRSDGGSDGAFDGVQSSGEVRKTVVAPSPQPELNGSIDSDEFRNLLIAARLYGNDPTHYTAGKDALVAHIDAWKDAACAAAAEEARRDVHETNVTCMNQMLKAQDRATDAEAKLAAIREGVATMICWVTTDDGELCQAVDKAAGIRNPEQAMVRLSSLLALIQPPSQSDTSGLAV